MKNNLKSRLNLFKSVLLCVLILMQFALNLNFSNYTVYAGEDSNLVDSIGISQDNYDEQMTNIVEPYINARKESGYINGEDGANLYYEKYTADNAKGNIVLSHGYTETLVKYRELTYYYLNAGYNVFEIEHRGHGRSGSLGVADKTQIYVDSFEQYITDLKTFMDEIVMPNSNGLKVFLFAHSMGGAIGARFLEEYPEYFDAAVLSSPMLEVNTGNVPSFLAKIIVKAAVACGQGGKYVIGKTPYTTDYNEADNGTSCLSRFLYNHDIVANDEELQRGGASYKWTDESFKMTKEITSKENASKVAIPVVLFQADHDTYVNPGGQNDFAKYAQNCTLVKVPGSRHEIYNEVDEIQKPYLDKLFDFYEDNL